MVRGPKLWQGRRGRRIRKEVGGKTKIDVQQKRQRLRSKADGTDDEAITVAQWFDRWLGSMKSRVRHGTFTLYSGIVRGHITPAIGYMLLSKLSAPKLQHFYTTLETKGASARTRQAIHARMFSALKSAVRLGILSRNVAEMVNAPRYAAPEVAPLSLAEVRTILVAARSERLYALFLLAVNTGARQGELFAIRRRDLDLEAGTVSINGTLKEDGSISPPKTARGRRRIDLSPEVIRALEQHIAENPGGDLLFTSHDGSPIRESNFIRRDWAPLLKKAGLPRIKFHTLRHTAATLMLSQAIHPKVVQETLGHSSIEMTMDVYSSVVPGMGRDAAEKLSKLLAV